MRKQNLTLYKLLATLSNGEIRKIRLELSKLKLKRGIHRAYFDFLVTLISGQKTQSTVIDWDVILKIERSFWKERYYGGQKAVLKNYLYNFVLRQLTLWRIKDEILWMLEGEFLLDRELKHQAEKRLLKARKVFHEKEQFGFLVIVYQLLEKTIQTDGLGGLGGIFGEVPDIEKGKTKTARLKLLSEMDNAYRKEIDILTSYMNINNLRMQLEVGDGKQH